MIFLFGYLAIGVVTLVLTQWHTDWSYRRNAREYWIATVALWWLPWIGAFWSVLVWVNDSGIRLVCQLGRDRETSVRDGRVSDADAK